MACFYLQNCVIDQLTCFIEVNSNYIEQKYQIPYQLTIFHSEELIRLENILFHIYTFSS